MCLLRGFGWSMANGSIVGQLLSHHPIACSVDVRAYLRQGSSNTMVQWQVQSSKATSNLVHLQKLTHGVHKLYGKSLVFCHASCNMTSQWHTPVRVPSPTRITIDRMGTDVVKPCWPFRPFPITTMHFWFLYTNMVGASLLLKGRTRWGHCQIHVTQKRLAIHKRLDRTTITYLQYTLYKWYSLGVPKI